MDCRTASVGKIKKYFSTLSNPTQAQCQGFFAASFAGPWWMRISARPTLNMTGLPNWQGKRFLTTNTATNVLLTKQGKVDALNMTLTAVTSYVDGKPGLALTYGTDAPAPWRWVRDELRMVDDNTILAITYVDLPILRWFPFPFMLHREPNA